MLFFIFLKKNLSAQNIGLSKLKDINSQEYISPLNPSIETGKLKFRCIRLQELSTINIGECVDEYGSRLMRLIEYHFLTFNIHTCLKILIIECAFDVTLQIQLTTPRKDRTSLHKSCYLKDKALPM